MRAIAIAAWVGLALVSTAQGQELRAEMYLITPEATNKPIGLVLISSTDGGPSSLPICRACRRASTASTFTRTATAVPARADDGTSAAGMAAGEHYDPERTGPIRARWSGASG